jgi:hypothetical protein
MRCAQRQQADALRGGRPPLDRRPNRVAVRQRRAEAEPTVTRRPHQNRPARSTTSAPLSPRSGQTLLEQRITIALATRPRPIGISLRCSREATRFPTQRERPLMMIRPAARQPVRGLQRAARTSAARVMSANQGTIHSSSARRLPMSDHSVAPPVGDDARLEPHLVSRNRLGGRQVVATRRRSRRR